MNKVNHHLETNHQEETRPDRAVRLFKEGYNCSQAVFGAYADIYDIEPELAFRISASFGGGMGRMREVCGAVSGMFLVAGMETGATKGKDAAGKKANYDMVQALAAEYRKKNGSIICKELLGLVPLSSGQIMKKENTGDAAVGSFEKVGELQAAQFSDTMPERRTEEYYKKRPCIELVRQACEILDTVLFEKKEE